MGIEQSMDAAGIIGQKLAQQDGVDAAFGEIVLDFLFIPGHHAFHQERVKFRHGWLLCIWQSGLVSTLVYHNEEKYYTPGKFCTRHRTRCYNAR